MTKVINLFGGPGAGKSTTAAGLFFEMKCAGISCELVREYAKDCVWAEDFERLKNQRHVFETQRKRTDDLIGKVDCIITDAPLLLSLYDGKKERHEFKAMVLNSVNAMNNINIKINRVKPYAEAGRMQNKEEAIEIDQSVDFILTGNYDFSVNGDRDAPIKILDYLLVSHLRGLPITK